MVPKLSQAMIAEISAQLLLERQKLDKSSNFLQHHNIVVQQKKIILKPLYGWDAQSEKPHKRKKTVKQRYFHSQNEHQYFLYMYIEHANHIRI